MTCPKCQYDQPESHECVRCGVIFAKLRGEGDPGQLPRGAPSNKGGDSPPQGTLLNIAIITGILTILAGSILAMNRDRLPQIGPPDVPWMEGDEGLYQGLSTLENQGKPTLVLFYTTWCSACKDLKRELAGNPGLNACLQRGTPVKIDIEANPRGMDLFQRIGFNSIPQMIVYRDPDEGPEHLAYGGSTAALIDACNDLMTPL